MLVLSVEPGMTLSSKWFRKALGQIFSGPSHISTGLGDFPVQQRREEPTCLSHLLPLSRSERHAGMVEDFGADLEKEQLTPSPRENCTAPTFSGVRDTALTLSSLTLTRINCSEYFPIFVSVLWVAGVFFHQGKKETNQTQIQRLLAFDRSRC